MDTHVRVLGVLYLGLSAVSLIFAVLIVIGFSGVAGVIGVAADPDDAAVAIPILTIIGTSLVSLLAGLALPGIVTGIGLLYFKPWARILGIVLSAILCAVAVLGLFWLIIPGGYGLWVLLSKDTEQLFHHSPATI